MRTENAPTHILKTLGNYYLGKGGSRGHWGPVLPPSGKIILKILIPIEISVSSGMYKNKIFVNTYLLQMWPCDYTIIVHYLRLGARMSVHTSVIVINGHTKFRIRYSDKKILPLIIMLILTVLQTTLPANKCCFGKEEFFVT